MADNTCANHSDTKAAINTLFNKVEKHEERIDLMETGGARRDERIDALCGQVERTNARIDRLINSLNRNTKYAITTAIAVMAILVPLAIWAVERFTASILALAK